MRRRDFITVAAGAMAAWPVAAWAQNFPSRQITLIVPFAAGRPTDVLARFLELGQETPPPDRQSPAALRDHQTAEILRWWPIVKAANIKAE